MDTILPAADIMQAYSQRVASWDDFSAEGDATRAAMHASGQTAKVAAALLLLPQALDFNVTVSPAEARAFVRQVEDSNRFESKRAVALLAKIDNLLAVAWGAETDHNYRVGREGSLVVYLDVHASQLPQGAELIDLLAQLRAAAKRAGCDEYGQGAHRFGGLTYRLWWD